MRKSGGAEKYVRVVQDMYESWKIIVRCAVGVTEEFQVEVCCLFAVEMDRLTDDQRGGLWM